MKLPIIQNRIECREVYDPDCAVSTLELHDMIEISFVVEGKGVHRILNETQECGKGDLFLLESGVPHKFYANSEDEYPIIRTIHFSPKDLLSKQWADIQNDNYCYGVFRDNSPISYSMLNSKAYAQIEGYFDTITTETKEKNMEYETVVKNNLILLLISVARYINLADTVKPIHTKEWSLISMATAEILKNFEDSEMTLESIANSLFVSKSSLSRLFQKVIGESFVDYVRNLRVNKACELLCRTSLTNEEIVGKCGLRDVPTFYKIFKASTGMTPYQYRMTNVIKGAENMSIINDISANLQKGKSKIVKELVEQALSEGVTAAQILNEGLISGMNIIGEKFKNNEVYVPEVLVAARAMNMGMNVIKPLLVEDGVQATGKVCIGTVQGDMHDIGKNLVKMMMEGKGLEVVDLGTDVAPETFVQAAINENCQVICCSALLTTTMDVMADVVKVVEEAGIRDKVKIMVGGAPVTEEFCKTIGADKYTSDAASAANAAVELCSL